jgi:hypothetical protein
MLLSIRQIFHDNNRSDTEIMSYLTLHMGSATELQTYRGNRFHATGEYSKLWSGGPESQGSASFFSSDSLSFSQHKIYMYILPFCYDYCKNSHYSRNIGTVLSNFMFPSSSGLCYLFLTKKQYYGKLSKLSRLSLKIQISFPKFLQFFFCNVYFSDMYLCALELWCF